MVKAVLFAGACLLAFGFWLPRNAAKFIDSGRKVTAVVEEHTPGGVQARVPYPAKLLLRYEFEGAAYRKRLNAVDPDWASLKKGDAVRLVLSETDPGRFTPERAVGRTGAVKRLGLFYVTLGTVLLILGAVFMARGRRHLI